MQRTMDDALALMRDLRARCDWDRVQTHSSLRPYLIEEAHEVDDAIAQGDDATLRDVVLQVRADEAHHRDVNHGFASTLAKLPPSPVPSAPYPPHATELRGAA